MRKYLVLHVAGINEHGQILVFRLFTVSEIQTAALEVTRRRQQ